MIKASMISEPTFAKRRKKILAELSESCAFFFSAPAATASRDISHPYRPDSDVLYLTGIAEADIVLVLRSKDKKKESFLYVREKNLTRELWEGPRMGVTWAKKHFDVTEVRVLERFPSDVQELCGSVPRVYSPLGVNPDREQLVFRMLRGSTRPSYPSPHTLTDSRLLTGPLRFIKDKDEITLLKSACDITVEGFTRILPLARRLPSEHAIARLLESEFSAQGGHGLSFNSMVALGPNCTNLHHSPGKHKPGKSELAMIDAGAACNYYGADVTRTFPVHGRFTPAQRTIYDIIEAARVEVVSEARPGLTIDHLHEIAVKSLTRGLAAAKVIKDSAASIILSGNYRRYFGHRIGHFLGLDTHDVGPYYHPKKAIPVPGVYLPLVPGCVITVEPGLYLQKNDESVAAPYRGIGIRIEDTLLITRGGNRNLTGHLPTQADEVEKLVLS